MMNKTIYALGFFDGVHRGHAALLAAARNLAWENGCLAGAVTFLSHPQSLVRGNAPALINSPEDRKTLILQYCHMDTLLELPFDEHMQTMPWEDFLLFLILEHGAAGFVCGDDFRFGHRGQGNAALLQQWCLQRGLPCVCLPEQTVNGIRISSTHIRTLLESGQMAEAVKFLGHPHILSGTVVSGRKLGRRLGIPTANLLVPEGVVQPRFGVYACRVIAEEKQYAAVTNIGNRPTVGGHRITVEPWILDFTGDLYGRQITLEFFDFLRPEQKFPDLEALKTAIHADAETTRNILSAF